MNYNELKELITGHFPTATLDPEFAAGNKAVVEVTINKPNKDTLKDLAVDFLMAGMDEALDLEETQNDLIFTVVVDYE